MKNLPFTALRTLESVVRLHGFGRAAEELNVTQSAVSQQIRALEDWMGHKLLFRGTGKTTPTDVGLRVAAAVLQGLEQCSSLPACGVPQMIHGFSDSSAPNILAIIF